MLLTPEYIRGVIAEKIPPGLVIAEHTDEGHFYRHVPTGVKTASITTKGGILDAPHLKKWAARLAVEHIDKNWNVLSAKGITIESKQLIYDAAVLQHQDLFEESGSIGTAGHKVVENYLLDWMSTGIRPKDIRAFIMSAEGGISGSDSRLYAIARSAEAFCIDFDVTPIVSEQFVFSVRHRAAGTMDSLMFVTKQTKPGKIRNCPHPMKLSVSTRNPFKMECRDCGAHLEKIFALVDWKTSNSIDKIEYAMQVSAYWQGLYDMAGLKPKEILIVRLDKDRCKYEVRRLVDRASSFKAWKHCAAVFDYIHDGRAKLVNYTPREAVSLDQMEFTIV